jgi:hypothetical protein
MLRDQGCDKGHQPGADQPTGSDFGAHHRDTLPMAGNLDERDRQRLESYRAEALSLFQINQAGRAAAERVLGLILAASAIAVAAGVNAGTDLVATALAPFVLLMMSYALQQYADVSVTGAARSYLEQRLADDFFDGEYPLIYERAVAGVRKRRPLVLSMRVLQGLSVVAILVAVAVGADAAFSSGRSWWIRAAFCAATIVSAVSVLLSYRAMLDSFSEAKRQIANELTANVPTP